MQQTKEQITYVEQERINQEYLEKKEFYKDVNSIKKNVQFFLWFTVVSVILSVILFLNFVVFI